MKKLALLPLVVLFISACNFADDGDYENLAKDACDCVNSASQGLSDQTTRIVVDSNGDLDKFQADFQEFTAENPAVAMEDLKELKKLDGGELKVCLEGLEKKYENVYSTKSEKEVQRKILTILKDMDDCKVAYTLMKVGMNAQ